MPRRSRRRAAGFPQGATSPFAAESAASPGTGQFEGQDILSEATGAGGGGKGGLNINIVNQAVANAIIESGPGGVTTGPVTGGTGGGMMMVPMMGPMMPGMMGNSSPFRAF